MWHIHCYHASLQFVQLPMIIKEWLLHSTFFSRLIHEGRTVKSFGIFHTFQFEMGGPLQKNHAVPALVLGIIEVVLGLIIVICSFVLAGKAEFSASLTPYWAGFAFLIPGIFGIIAGITKSFGVMIAFMVLNIIAFIIEGVGCILVALVVAIWAGYVDGNCTRVAFTQSCRCYANGSSTIIHNMETCDIFSTISAIMYILVVFLVLASLITLASSILGCIAVCCNSNQPGTVIIQQPISGQHYDQKH